MTYELLEKCVKQEFKWYADAEHLLLDNNIITDFLRYWLNDGASCMCYNLANKSLYDAKHLYNELKIINLSERQWKNYEKRLFNDYYCECRFSIMFIIQHFESLSEYGYFKDNVKSMFGSDLWKNPLELKQKIINFALLDKTISKFDLEML